MAVLARHHRGKLPAKPCDELPQRLHGIFYRLLTVLRLAIVLARSRTDADLPQFKLTWASGEQPRLELDAERLASRPLTAWGLEQEVDQLTRLGVHLSLVSPDQ